MVTRYNCSYCVRDKPPKKGMRWTCLTHSEVWECHPGYGEFSVALDAALLHLREISGTGEFHEEYTLANGIVLKNFVSTPNGMLSDKDLHAPGTLVYYISGLARHTGLYHVANKGEWGEYSYLNEKFAGLRAHFFGTIYLLNPAQQQHVMCGKLAFDLNPKLTAKWFTIFLETWSDFTLRNPKITIPALCLTDDSVWYGDPAADSDAKRLYSYNGLPLLLVHYRNRIAGLVSQILILGQLKATDPTVVYPGT